MTYDGGSLQDIKAGTGVKLYIDSDYRGVLAGLEGISGKKAIDSDSMTVKN